MQVSDIEIFFNASSRDDNDAANKRREALLGSISNNSVPLEWFSHEIHGIRWTTVRTQWERSLKSLAERTEVPPYDSITIGMKGGRRWNYDAEVSYIKSGTSVAKRKIEFKYGGGSIEKQPQILSLQAKFGLFTLTYDRFYYENYLDEYLKTDAGISEPKPTWALYEREVRKTKSAHPFWLQLKAREEIQKEAKNGVVNRSITDYLTKHGASIDLKGFAEKVKATQTDKFFLMWMNGEFHIDTISTTEMNDMKFNSIINGNVLEVRSGNTAYGLLLRWRNHKGILNPAWQISLKRVK